MTTSVDDWLDALPDEQKQLLIELRKLVKSANKEFVEEIKWGQPCYSLNKLVCYLKNTKAHVVLGFQQGAHLKDPKKLLEGTGKDMRHIKVSSSRDIQNAAFKSLIKEAIKFDSEER